MTIQRISNNGLYSCLSLSPPLTFSNLCIKVASKRFLSLFAYFLSNLFFYDQIQGLYLEHDRDKYVHR
jgi:hypothetical protein